MTEILSQIYNTLFNSIWIGILTFIYCHFTYKRNIDKLTNNLTNQQILLHKDILRLKRIVDTDNNLCKEQFHLICGEIDKIKTTQEINGECNGNENEDEDEDDNKDKIILPIQNHIKYPNCWIFNEKNFTQTTLPNNNYELRCNSNNIRLISTQ